MGNWISQREINEYLLRIKKAITRGKYRFISRRKNVESLAVVGILPSQVKEFLFNLTYQDYFNGPEEEDNEKEYLQGECLFFGCSVMDREFYVKIKLCKEENEEYCYCISFHIAEKKIVYPYRRK